ncbi:putative uncharacterized protein DDB_G0282499 [Chelonus insularis]|uniref:putative uncharacterized protein DDB_G0282499 n=1 Tax=Chelonus insularis TaxID=460826 RepID=UPI0015897D1F|nr:putative uncharacterized protein DDB_G0282499 [Chelonus insularis]
MVSYTLCFFLITLSLSNANLLEMSRTLWSKFLNGGLSNIGSLDPLRIPQVKVDQSHGHTSYRLMLSNVQIFGLNSSTLESIHIGRGSVKSNSSEKEAGYVTYTDQNIIDSIRYRFHTADQESNKPDQTSEKLGVESIEKFGDGSRSRNQDDGLSLRAHSNRNEEQKNNYQNRQPVRYQQYQQYRSERYRNREDDEIRNQFGNNRQYNEQSNDRSNSHDYQHQQHNYHNHQYQTTKYTNYHSTTPRPNVHNRENEDRPVHLVYAHQQMNINSRDRSRSHGEQSTNQQNPKGTIDVSINNQNYRSYNNRGNSMRHSSESSTESCSHHDHQSSRLENQPGFVDIVYTRRQYQEEPHFGKLTVEKKGNETVYSIEDVLRDLDNHKRFIIHNFTEEELLLKKNDQMRTALESKRIHDLIRYAREFQEKHGYFEEGMELKYHYGNENNSKMLDVKRTKRAHVERDNEDDIVHVVAKIRVPLLKVKADYNLMGTVEKTILRGNGQFNGEFTELIGYFTVELRKIGDSSLMVRATRAKLVAESKNVNLQGMNENGPVKEILTQGLMAAEAVAAMLVDDLTTKVLNETTNDAIIFKMYKDLPNN